MIEVYSALVLHSAGLPITEENIKKILEAINANVDEAKIKALVSSLEGVNIDEAIKEAAIGPTAAPKEETKEEKKEEEESKEKKEEEAVAGLGALFG